VTINLTTSALGLAPRPLPTPRGPLCDSLFTALRRPPAPLAPELIEMGRQARGDDHALALYCCYELHYGGFGDVDVEWEWEPSLLALRQVLERSFERELRALVGYPPGDAGAVEAELWRLATSGGGRSLSGWVADQASLEQFRELAKHRSAYQLKEADPHTWAIPRVRGEAKAVMVAIQADEYGNGRGADMHASLFADTMSAVGLDPTPNAYLDEIPGPTLATTNLISLFGLHRRWRGALIGHLALFEMTSVGPMTRYANALARFGLPSQARRFYDVHVVADEVHQHLAVEGMVRALLAAEPELASDVLFGAIALQALEGRVTDAMLDDWEAGRSSLRLMHKVG
jgi:hypothetical protein